MLCLLSDTLHVKTPELPELCCDMLSSTSSWWIVEKLDTLSWFNNSFYVSRSHQRLTLIRILRNLRCQSGMEKLVFANGICPGKMPQKGKTRDVRNTPNLSGPIPLGWGARPYGVRRSPTGTTPVTIWSAITAPRETPSERRRTARPGMTGKSAKSAPENARMGCAIAGVKCVTMGAVWTWERANARAIRCGKGLLVWRRFALQPMAKLAGCLIQKDTPSLIANSIKKSCTNAPTCAGFAPERDVEVNMFWKGLDSRMIDKTE